MKDIFKTALYIIGSGIVLTIIFVRAGTNGNESGAKQASEIISSTSKGISDIIKSSTGV